MTVKIRIRSKPSLCESCYSGHFVKYKDSSTINYCTYVNKDIEDIVEKCTHYEFKYADDDISSGRVHSLLDDDKWQKEGIIVLRKDQLRKYGVYI